MNRLFEFTLTEGNAVRAVCAVIAKDEEKARKNLDACNKRRRQFGSAEIRGKREWGSHPPGIDIVTLGSKKVEGEEGVENNVFFFTYREGDKLRAVAVVVAKKLEDATDTVEESEEWKGKLRKFSPICPKSWYPVKPCVLIHELE